MHTTSAMTSTASSAEPSPVYAEELKERMLQPRNIPQSTLQPRSSVCRFGPDGLLAMVLSLSVLSPEPAEHSEKRRSRVCSATCR